MKEKNKTQTSYSYNIYVSGEPESFEITQEENVIDRHAILVKLYQERWRTPRDYVEFLEKVLIIIKKDFIKT